MGGRGHADVLILLARRIDSVPALVLASFRDDELPRAEGLRLVVGDLAGRATRLKVAPLSLPAVAQLAELYGVDGKELHRTTGSHTAIQHPPPTDWQLIQYRGTGAPPATASGARATTPTLVNPRAYGLP